MSPLFVIAASLTLAGAVAAFAFRNLIRSALALAGSFVGLALIYLDLGAQFAGLAQILVYVGAVAILIVFAILLTRGGEPGPARLTAGSTSSGIGVALLVLGSLVASLLGSRLLPDPAGAGPIPGDAASARNLGLELMTEYVLPLEAVGLLLTAALIGALLVAFRPGESGGASKLEGGGPADPGARGGPSSRGEHA